jgi:hypothetical protein
MEEAKKIILVGGGGFIGTELSRVLLSKGYKVVVIDLNSPKFLDRNLSFIKKDLTISIIEKEIISGSYAVINLAGANIGRRWNKKLKEVLLKSRVDTTSSIVRSVRESQSKPKILINASAIGYYGDRGDEILSEESEAGQGFVSELCIRWEEEAKKAEDLGLRVIIIRTANVLGYGGILNRMLPFFKLGIGVYFGKGGQYMPWIHYQDVVGVYIHALENNLQGAYNTGAGSTITQKELFKAFAEVLGKPRVFKLPYFFTKIVFGEFADVLVSSQNTVSDKLKNEGYKFIFEDVRFALRDIFRKK